MAVSQMQKLSLILPKDDLDSLLLALQSEAKIQIYDLSAVSYTHLTLPTKA